MRPGLLILAGCAVEDVRNADLQLDIVEAELGEHPDETIVRVCVTGVGNHEEALGAGAVAFTGLPADTALEVWVDALAGADSDESVGSAGPLTLSPDAPWSQVEWTPCAVAPCAACQATGDLVRAGQDDALLAVRFVGL